MLDAKRTETNERRTAVEGGKGPRLVGMKVNALDSLAASEELAL
jgi:hypothetical protein